MNMNLDDNNILLPTDRQKIRSLFGKTKDDVDKDIDIILEWLKTQKHLPDTLSRNAIERTLVVTKFSIERTKKFCDLYYTARSLAPEIFKNCNPKIPEQNVYMNKRLYYLPLPKLTKENYRVVVIKFRETDFSDYSPFRFLAHAHMLFEVMLEEDLNMGEIGIIDFKHIGKTHVLSTTPTHAKAAKFLTEQIWSSRVKGIHFINVPSYGEILIPLVKTIVNAKVFSRVHIHDSYDKIFEYIPKEILPIDYGGHERSLEELNEQWKNKLETYTPRFDFLQQVQVNESLRPEPLLNTDILGYYGNFKKIDID